MGYVIAILALVLISILVGFIIGVVLCADTDVSRETLADQISIMFKNGETADYNTPHYITVTSNAFIIETQDKTSKTTYRADDVHGIYWKIVK